MNHLKPDNKIKQNIADIKMRIASALKRAGRNDDVTLVAVTKYSDINDINAAIEAGVKVIGENRLQQALLKLPDILPVKKHFIGHLQTNKVKKVLEHFDCIESVDSVKLAKEINKRATRPVPIFLEVNIANEPQKYGISLREVKTVFKEINALPNIVCKGLMCVVPHIEPEKTRPYFAKLRSIGTSLGLKEFSMGMSNDFEIAIEEGSTNVRIGSSIFL